MGSSPISSLCGYDGIGRHEGLKIPWLWVIWVRLPLSTFRWNKMRDIVEEDSYIYIFTEKLYKKVL